MAFLSPVPLPSRTTTTSSSQSSCPLRPPPRACAKPAQRPGPLPLSSPFSSRSQPAPSPQASSSLVLDRRDVEGESRRTLHLRRDATLRAAGVVDGDGAVDAEEPLALALAIRPVGDGYSVLGRVDTRVWRHCDRCCGGFWERVDGGRFEVWLDTGAGGGEDAEAVEQFVGPRARLDLAEHVRDAVLLSLPTRAVCGDNCQGVSGGGGFLDERGRIVGEVKEEGSKAKAAIVGLEGIEKLLEMKRRLEGGR